jgi:hypothetical protein
MSALPQTPKILLEELFTIFPQYRSNYDKYGPLSDSPPTFHSILIEFTVFFGTEATSFSETQLKKFGTLVNEAVAHEGQLGNAFDTCLLEHLHQIGAKDLFSPYLSKIARDKTYA